jgi:hypothetical protein
VGTVDHSDEGVSYREATAMHDAIRKEILAEIHALEILVETRFEQHYTRHEKDVEIHQGDHRRDADRRNGYIRWAVTTLMTGLGVLIALYAALGRG